MEVETFYGVTLSEKEPLAHFEISETDNFEKYQKLIIKQIILGAEAKPDEYNVVTAETSTPEKDKLKIPIAVLKANETRILKPNIEFPSSSVTFKLVQGLGPVYIHGQHVINEADPEDGYFEEEMDDYEYEGSKKPNANGKSPNCYKRK